MIWYFPAVLHQPGLIAVLELILPAETALPPDDDGCQHSIPGVQQLQPIKKKT